MSLQKQLDQIRADAKIRIPKENRAIMRNATAWLVQSGQLEKALNVGDVAPDFVLADSTGATWDSLALLRNGPLLLIFFRGHW